MAVTTADKFDAHESSHICDLFDTAMIDVELRVSNLPVGLYCYASAEIELVRTDSSIPIL